MKMKFILFTLATLLPVSAFASDGETVVRLTPAEAQAAVQAGGKAHAQLTTVDTDTPKHGLNVHGEVGVAVGTGGTRAVFGTIVAPLGNDGVLALSFANGTIGRQRWR